MPGEEDNQTQPAHPRDRGWAWVILLAAWMNMFFTVGMYKTIGIFFIEFQKKYNSSSSMTSLTISLLNLGYSLTTLFVSSVLLTVISSRQCAVIGAVLMCLVYIMSSFAPTIEILVLTYGLFLGCSQSFILAPSTTLLGQYFDKRRSLANCVAQIGASTGSLVFPILLRALLDNYGLFGTLFFVGGINLHLLISATLMRPTGFYLDRNVKMLKAVNRSVNQDVNLTVKDRRNSETGAANIPLMEKCQNRESTTKQKSDKLNHNEREISATKNLTPPEVSVNGIHKDLQETFVCYSPVVARAISDRNPVARRQHISEFNSTSDRDALEAAISSSSIGRKPNLGLYASTELSVSSVLDLRSADGVTFGMTSENSAKEIKTTDLCCLGKKTIVKLSNILDCRVLRRPPFWLFLPSACLLCNSCSMMMVFLPPHARDKGLTDSEITIFMSVIGAVDIISLLFWGLIADCGLIKRYQLVTVATVLFGMIAHLISFFEHFTSFVILSIICGLFGRVYFSMFPVLLVDFLGLEYLRSALGLLIMIQTTFSASVIPLLGQIRDSTGSYVMAFHVMGIMMIAGGLWVQTVPLAVKHEERGCKKGEKKQQEQISVEVP